MRDKKYGNLWYGKNKSCVFFKSYWQSLSELLKKVYIQVGDITIGLNKEAMHWLGIRLNSQLKPLSHMNKKMKRARITQIQIWSLTKVYGLVLGLIWQIQLVVL